MTEKSRSVRALNCTSRSPNIAVLALLVRLAKLSESSSPSAISSPASLLSYCGSSSSESASISSCSDRPATGSSGTVSGACMRPLPPAWVCCARRRLLLPLFLSFSLRATVDVFEAVYANLVIIEGSLGTGGLRSAHLICLMASRTWSSSGITVLARCSFSHTETKFPREFVPELLLVEGVQLAAASALALVSAPAIPPEPVRDLARRLSSADSTTRGRYFEFTPGFTPERGEPPLETKRELVAPDPVEDTLPPVPSWRESGRRNGEKGGEGTVM